MVGHTVLSFNAALFGGFMFYGFIRPIVGRERYSKTPHDPIMISLLLVIVLLGGVVAYRRWADSCAFFAWVLPSIWACHILLSRGIDAMQGQWFDRLFFLETALAYSVGALLAATVFRETLKKPPPSELS